MPGTPYMLIPLNLSAYLPGAIVGDSDPELPDEFAIIAYPSQEVWNHDIHETLRGRVYNQMHGGVYDLKRSGASFPTNWSNVPEDGLIPYYLFETLTDWQSGATRVVVGARTDTATRADAMRRHVRRNAGSTIERLAVQGFDQAIVMPGAGYCVIWMHSISPSSEELDPDIFGPASRTILNMDATRVQCGEEPLALTISQTTALNFIFERNQIGLH